MMKKLLLSVVLIAGIFKARADEGMWLPMLLGQQVYNDMVKKGLKLTKEQLYSINKASLKDAIIIFGGGCTGEIVSDKGLIFTNHHCGYGAIAAASSVENNYLRDGFYAKNFNEEIKTALTVQFLEKIVDVTEEVEAQLKGLSWEERTKKLSDVYKSITDKVKDEKNGVYGRVYSMFNNNQYIMYVYKVYRDIRLVGTPPESVGKFGGDTDNWEWPRHTGDFSIFRVYTSPDGNPAEYSTANIPLKPKHFLPISLKGVKDGTFSMIWGYPGGTNRYETSMGVKLKVDIDNPSLVALRDVRLKYMYEQMVKDPAVKLKLASSYAGIANYWKFFDGESKQLIKHNVYAKKQAYENNFNQWAKGKPEYETIMQEYIKNYAEWTTYSKHRVYIREGVLGSSLASMASGLISLENALTKGDDLQKVIEGLKRRREAYIKNADFASDVNILAATAMKFYNDIDKTQYPKDVFERIAAYGNLDDFTTFKKWAAYVYENTLIKNNDKWNAFIENPTTDALNNDPAYLYAGTLLKNYNEKYAPLYEKFTDKNNELAHRYMKGIREMNPEAVNKMYPDANFSMRVSYGTVGSYSPKDAAYYDYVTTSKGIFEKYIPGDYEFNLPDKQIELLRNRDFGRYIDKKRKDLVINFITNHDITGGNSGSPVIDGKGRLIGLAFDGNYEALSHKLAFDKDLNRTICVDIRYVLWCIDKLGGATNIINELKIIE